MAKRKNLTVIHRPRIELNPPGVPRYERSGQSPVVIDPMPTRTPMNVAPKIIGTGEDKWAKGNFTTPFNLTPRVADEVDE